MPKIAIVTDSTAYIPKEYLDQYPIRVTPQVLVWGEQTLLDGIDIQPEEFYNRLAKDPVHPTTSQATPAAFLKIYSELLEQDYEILSILVSAKLSGTIESANQAKEMFPGAPIEIVYPSDGSLVIVTHMAGLKKAPHPNAAKLFMEFVMGPEFGAIMTSEGRHSLDPAVPTAPGVKRISEIKAGRLTIDQVKNGIPPLIERWNATFGG